MPADSLFDETPWLDQCTGDRRPVALLFVGVREEDANRLRSGETFTARIRQHDTALDGDWGQGRHDCYLELGADDA